MFPRALAFCKRVLQTPVKQNVYKAGTRCKVENNHVLYGDACPITKIADLTRKV